MKNPSVTMRVEGKACKQERGAAARKGGRESESKLDSKDKDTKSCRYASVVLQLQPVSAVKMLCLAAAGRERDLCP